MARSPFGYEEKEGEVLAPSYKLIKSKTVELNQIVKPWFNNGKGEVVGRRYDKERMLNNAAALQHISKRTTIPVPRLIGFGVNADGTAWIEMERSSHNGIWLPLVKDECRMPTGKKHVAEASAPTQVAHLGHGRAERGSDSAAVGDGVGAGRLLAESGREEYVFCQGNLHLHSIMMHADTLHVLKIVDWENGGYFPPKFLNVWSLERSDYEEYYANGER